MTATGAPSGATGTRIRFDVFDAKCAEMGALDETARAALADIDRVTLWRWRNGKQTPSLDAIARIGARLGLKLDELIGAA